MINPDSPAFPRSSQGPSGDLDMDYGLTIRAYIAAKILPGLISSPKHLTFNGEDVRTNDTVLAKMAVTLADALIDELNKQP